MIKKKIAKGFTNPEIAEKPERFRDFPKVNKLYLEQIYNIQK